MNELVSLIIPVYNIEKYIANCLDSVISQTYTNLEIIVVDDGSTDKSGEICDKYAQTDSRIYVIHQENRGLSGARNHGISESKGDFLFFLDGDDFITSDCIEALLDAALKCDCDVSAGGTLFCTEEGNEIQKQCTEKSMVLNTYEQLELLLKDNKTLPTTAWGKLYKKELFNEIEFPVGRYHEDVFTTYLVLAETNKMVIIPQAIYWYRQVSQSITHVSFKKKHLDSLYAAIEREKWILKYYPGLGKLAKASVCYSACQLFVKMNESKYDDTADIQFVLDAINRTWKDILKCDFYSGKTHVSAIMFHFLPGLSKWIIKHGL